MIVNAVTKSSRPLPTITSYCVPTGTDDAPVVVLYTQNAHVPLITPVLSVVWTVAPALTEIFDTATLRSAAQDAEQQSAAHVVCGTHYSAMQAFISRTNERSGASAISGVRM